jgi:hypothetical protein
VGQFGRFLGILTGLLVIIAGVIILLGNLGILNRNIVELIVDLWPLTLIAIGAYFIWRRFRPLSELSPTRVSEPIDGIARAEVEVEFGAGELLVNGLEKDGLLFEGTSLFEVEKSTRRSGDTVKVKLRRAPGAWLSSTASLHGDRSELFLSRKLPLMLRFNMGACRAVIDLTENKIERVEVNTGESDVTVRLPREAGFTRAIAKGGAATIRLEVPEGVAARIVSRGCLSSLNIDEKRFPKTADGFLSTDYDVAPNKVDIEIDTGVSGVSVV